jgi:predicted enzyme related to lactoylglutathione lyase
MLNFRVEDLDEVLRALRSEGCDVDDRVDVSEFGRFGWVADPEGNRVELWEPPAAG